MDSVHAEEKTGLDSRHMPDATYEFLRCQLGRFEAVSTKISAYKSVNETIFRLYAFGETFDKAVEMLEEKKRAKASR